MNYRSEIDGLRSLAILPVILFHAGFKFFSGGFIGVDIFFVISGYLITSIIIKEKESGVFTLIDFYERRARRILPALFFVMLVSLPLAWFWLIPEDMKSFSKSLISICSFSSNIFYWLSEGYFSTSSELIPFLHTWSLSVEEQYYLFFPILLIIIWKFRFRFTLELIIFLALISFVLAEWASLIKPSAAFYLLPSRAWELLLGSCVALYLSFNNTYKPSKSTKNTLSFLGLFLILYGVLYLDKNTPFPGVYALIPTIGASLIILYATNETITGKVLSNKILVSVGLLSYSAYLWHQPLFAFARHRSIDNPSQTTFLILSILTFVLAYFSWKYIEKPFREKNKFTKKQIFTYAACGSIFFIAIGVTGDLNKGFLSRFNLKEETKNSLIPSNKGLGCFDKSDVQNRSDWLCRLGKENKETSFFVFGDSHSLSFFNSLDEISNKKNITGSYTGISGCIPFLGIYALRKDQIDKNCNALNKRVFEYIKNNQIKKIYLIARWTYYTDGGYDGKNFSFIGKNHNSKPNKENSREAFLFGLSKTIQSYNGIGTKVYIITQVPEQIYNAKNLYYKLSRENKDNTASIKNSSVRKLDHEKLQFFVNRSLAEFGSMKMMTIINFDNIFCDKNICLIGSKDESYYLDNNHLSLPGERLILNPLKDFF